MIGMVIEEQTSAMISTHLVTHLLRTQTNSSLATKHTATTHKRASLYK